METAYTPGGISNQGRGGWVGASKSSYDNKSNMRLNQRMSNNSNDDTDSLEEYEYFEDFNDKLQPQVTAARPSQTGRSVSLPAITSASNSSHSTNTQINNGNRLLKTKTSNSVNNNNYKSSMQVEDLEDLDLKRQGKTGVSYASKPGPKIQTLPTKALPSSSTSSTSTSTSTSASSHAASLSSAAAAAPASPAGGKTGKLCCDKCDGNHETDACPYYKKSRDSHPDAQKNF